LGKLPIMAFVGQQMSGSSVDRTTSSSQTIGAGMLEWHSA
jgi:hypothetical protein